jgi:Domain of unknown function (DUF4136)
MRHQANLILGLLCLAASVTLAIAGVTVSVEQDPKADLAALRTYRWLPTPPYLNQQPAEARDPRQLEALDEQVRASVDRALGEKRFKTAGSTATPDFHVVYYAAVGTGMNVGVLGAHYGYVTGWGSAIVGANPTTSPKVIDEGTLVIDILRRDRAVAIWRGTATGTVDRTRTDEERRQTIASAVKEMFAKFPRSR